MQHYCRVVQMSRHTLKKLDKAYSLIHSDNWTQKEQLSWGFVYLLKASDGGVTCWKKVTKVISMLNNCIMQLGLVLIRWRRVFMVWHCWLAFHSSLHGIQSESNQHDCCLFIHRAGNGRVQAARTKPQTLEHSGTLCRCRGSQSTPCPYWHRHMQALRSTVSLLYNFYCSSSSFILLFFLLSFRVF